MMRMWPISMRVNKPENVDPAGTDIGLKLRGFAELSCMARLLSLRIDFIDVPPDRGEPFVADLFERRAIGDLNLRPAFTQLMAVS